jgi:hypothetical protein
MFITVLPSLLDNVSVPLSEVVVESSQPSNHVVKLLDDISVLSIYNVLTEPITPLL